MASLSSVSGTSSANSIYGSRNVISGLASGMDTETMIENAVSGIKTRISGLQQKRTKVEWQQEAYRSIISKMIGFNDKYTSYLSSTNLLSPSFFNNAVTTTTHGENASKISATGKTSSDISILGVKQLASAARYTVSGSLLGGSSGIPSATAGGEINLGEPMDLSTISGSMSLQYGGRTVSIDFGELETFDSVDDLAAAIKDKLGEQKITLSNGSQKKASDLIGVDVNSATGEISFRDLSSGGNSVFISSASNNIKEKLGIDTSSGEKQSSFTVSDVSTLKTQKATSEYLSDKSMSITLDGQTKSIGMPTQEEIDAYKHDNAGADDNAAYVGVLQNKIDRAFGAGKLTVSNANGADTQSLKLNFTAAREGSIFSVTSKVGEALGFKDGLTSYVNTGSTLGSLGILSDDMALKYTGALSTEGEGDAQKYFYEDSAGKKVYTDANGYHINADGKKLYSFKLNGVEIGQYTEDTALESVTAAINNNTEAGVKVTYSKITNEFVFTAKDTGASGQISFDSDLAKKMFTADTANLVRETDANGNETWYQKAADGTADRSKRVSSASAGTDAIFTATINGTEMELTRSSNLTDLDGLKVTLDGTFGYTEAGALDRANMKAVTFTTKADADKIVDAVKGMVEDFNAMISEIKSAYSTMPAEKNSTTHTRYEPLTDEDMEGMSESAIKAYEEKAKQGILFADRDLSSLYNKMRSAISPSGSDGSFLRSIGIGTAYSDGLTALSFDEEKFRAALENDPDKVKDAFTKSKEGGASTDGLMQTLKAQLDNYASKTGASKGVLVQKAGSPLVPTSVLENSLKDMLENYDKQIEKWETKLANQVDRYTTQFSRLEQLVAQMNNQSSMLSGLMGGN